MRGGHTIGTDGTYPIELRQALNPDGLVAGALSDRAQQCAPRRIQAACPGLEPGRGRSMGGKGGAWDTGNGWEKGRMGSWELKRAHGRE